MRTKTEKLISARDVALFVSFNNPPFAKWPWLNLLQWVQWACEEGFVIPISSDNEHMDGVVIARPVMELAQMQEPYSFDPEGKWVYIDVAIALKPEVLKAIAAALRIRFGLREAVFWHRRRSNGTLHGFQAVRVLQKLLPNYTIESRG
jgi:hypothetical protein